MSELLHFTKYSTVPNLGAIRILKIYNYAKIRYHALINNSAWCVIYKNKVFLEIRKRQHIAGFVKKVRDDGKIDPCLQKPGPE